MVQITSSVVAKGRQRRQKLVLSVVGLGMLVLAAVFFFQPNGEVEMVSEMLRTHTSQKAAPVQAEAVVEMIPAPQANSPNKAPGLKLSADTDRPDSFVSCGSHIAPDCSRCLTGNANTDVWEHCNSDCSYDVDAQICRPAPGPVSCGGHFADTCKGCLDGGHDRGWCNGDCTYDDTIKQCKGKRSFVHPAYHKLFSPSSKSRAFQQVRNDKDERVNIVLLKTPLDAVAWDLVEKYKKDVLFMGISSFESFPLSSPNPFSANFSDDLYRNAFPGWLTMMHHPEEYFHPSKSQTKYILLSQSDFSLDRPIAFGRKYETILPKKYDWVYSGTDQNVLTDCVGWASFAKNWTFMLEALEVMCSPEFNLTGVIIANKDKSGKKACWIPDSCRDKVVQTTFLPNQTEFYEYTVQSHFMMVPNVYDASPRVATQSLALNVPVLMNRNIIGGWKYLNEETGEFFDDMSNFADQLRKIVDKSRRGQYHPRDYMEANYGNEKAGAKFKNFVEEHFKDYVKLPQGTKWLYPA